MIEQEMSKQQMAEWLAEKVLGWERKSMRAKCWVGKGFGLVCDYEIVEKIYSPDGFFAVWDAVEKADLEISINWFRHGELGDIYGNTVRIMIDSNTPFAVKHKDRYEAFYNAVFEAFKE